MPNRRPVHVRQIRVEAFARDDGLWDLEASLADTKSRDCQLAASVRAAGDPIHEMHLAITIDTEFNVLDASAQSHRVPYPGYCETIAPEYAKLVGLNLMRNFRAESRDRLGGIRGCTHLTELAAVLPTAAVQAFAGEVFGTRDNALETEQPRQLDRCHALRTDGPAVAAFYPRWYRTAALAVSEPKS